MRRRETYDGDGNIIDVEERPFTEQEIAQLIQAIKAEAARRIEKRFPVWKQSNATIRALSLLRAGEANWDADQQQQAEDDEKEFLWLESVREASNQLEDMNPIPEDFTADGYWPV